MKIAINNDYGGFCLSAKAMKKIAELKGHEVFFYKREKSNIDEEIYIKVDEEMFDKSYGFGFGMKCVKKDYGDKVRAFGNEVDCFEDRRWNNKRNDPDLIKAIEELRKKASAYRSDIIVIEIPDDVEWIIQDYDGIEWVAEKHRVWGNNFPTHHSMDDIY